jgi:archaemetzincin
MISQAGFSQSNIIISPVDQFDDQLLNLISGEIKSVFNCNTQITPLLQNIDFALDQNREQYHSTLIIEQLAKTAPPYALKVIGITKKDLFIPILTYVYGEAQLGGKASIISTNRLNEGISSSHTDPRFAQRVAKEAVHELGHTFNLRHCRENTCVMHYGRGIEDVDKKSNQLCGYCKVLLDDEIKRL